MSSSSYPLLEKYGVGEEEAIGLLSRFVAVRSPTGEEAEMASTFAAAADELGLASRLQQIAPDRFNAIAEGGSGSGPTLLFNGHMDSSHSGREPHLKGAGYRPEATIKGEWLMGLGCYNMKSGLTAALIAASAVNRSGGLKNGRVIVAGVSGEVEKAGVDEFQGPEYMGYGFGTRQLVAHGLTADMGIVCEPTGFQIGTGHLGALWLKISVTGESTHTVFSGPDTDHAVVKGARLVDAIEKWGREYSARNTYKGEPAHVSVGAIRGGWPWRISRTPATCDLYVDIRLVPGQRPNEVIAEIASVVGAVEGATEHTITPYVIAPAVDQESTHPVFKAVRDAHQESFGESAEELFRGPMADTGHLVGAGIPTVTYGLGPMASFDVVHEVTGEAGEHIRIPDYLKLIEIYMRVIELVCR